MKRSALFTIALLAAMAAMGAEAAPFVPRSGAEVLETLPRRAGAVSRANAASAVRAVNAAGAANVANGASAVGAADAAVSRLRARWSGARGDPLVAAALAQRYIELGRTESDPRYFGYAQAVLAPWWHAPAPPAAVLLLRATLLQSSHRFEEALRDLEALTSADPANAQGWLTLATVQVVRGQNEAAVRSCGRLSSLASELASLTCLANARAAGGQLAASEHLLALAVERAGTAAEPGLRTWALTLLGELAARRGDPSSAEARFRQALAIAPDDSYLLGAYADMLLDQHRYAEVKALLGSQQRIDSLLLRYALALQASAAPEASAAVAELQARLDAAARRDDAIHQREQARFELFLRHDVRAALRLALANWQVQKEPADLRILLEAALAARAPAAARQALAWRRQRGIEDSHIAALARKLEGGPA